MPGCAWVALGSARGLSNSEEVRSRKLPSQATGNPKAAIFSRCNGGQAASQEQRAGSCYIPAATWNSLAIPGSKNCQTAHKRLGSWTIRNPTSGFSGAAP
ncbi:hypothetical protein U1Q18_051454 [Sarracenia purpurea var. burkii]